MKNLKARTAVIGLALVALMVPAAGAVGAEDDTTEQEMLEQYWQDLAATELSTSSLKTRAMPVGETTGTYELLGSALADECYAGIGVAYPDPIGEDDGGVVCPEGSVEKTNESYVWGMTQADGKYFFGTFANALCLVYGGYLGQSEGMETGAYVCEFGNSQYADQLPPGYESTGDWRPPVLYMYDDATGELTTLEVPGAEQMLIGTGGIRAAGSAGGVVLLAGPAQTGGLNVFAFDYAGNFLGAENLADYASIRKIITAGGTMYTGVQYAADGSGRLLKWVGDTDDPFAFIEVGTTPAEIAELTVFKGRIAAATWPSWGGSGEPAGVYLSKPLGRLRESQDPLEELWLATDYEPDPVVALTYGAGALAVKDGYLYWGTMHVPGVAFGMLSQIYGLDTEEEAITAFLGTHRAISIFRIGSSNKAEPEVVYGSSVMPVYDGEEWSLQPSLMGEPLQGPPGMGNLFNNYTWTMAATDDELVIGTMDWSYLIGGMLEDLEGLEDVPADAIAIPQSFYGGDLWRIVDGKSGEATLLSSNGLDNYLNYGFRTMISEGDSLVIGTANPMNLMSDGDRDGGWELLRYTPPSVG